MTRSKRPPLWALLLLGSLVTGTAVAAPAVPVVYQDEHILVRAGLAEAGSQAIHLGDAVSFVVDVEFDAGAVQLETPDDEWFQRAFGSVAGIRSYASLAIAEETAADGRVRIASHWQIQVLDCPADTLSCPGSKSYELPIMTISYQLAGGTAERVDSRSARFRPWPGRLDVASAIALQPGQGSALTDVLPGGAWPQIMTSAGSSYAGTWLFAGGAALLLASLLSAQRQGQPVGASRRAQPADTRWRRALSAAGDATLSPEERSDILRRAVTWYCIDELDRNPYAWLGPGGADAVPAETKAAAWRELFIELLGQPGVDADDVAAFARRFDALSAASSDSAAAVS